MKTILTILLTILIVNDINSQCLNPPSHVDVNSECYQGTIIVDPFCCNVAWDGICETTYNNCINNNIPNCVVNPPINQDLCYTLVILSDPFCCNVAWDGICENSYNNCLPLPVELINFSLSCENNYHELNWTTVSETNNKKFLIEGSYNGKEFIDIDTIKGQGTTNKETKYTYNIRNKFNYYKLKQVDYDGQFEYFGPISVDCERNEFKVFPNPVKDILSITGNVKNSSESISVEISDMLGNLVYSETFIEKSNIIYKEINISGLKPGTYIVKVNNQFFKTIKQ